MTLTPAAPVVGTPALPAQEWLAREAAHHERADALTAARRSRRERGEKDPIEDFLYEYYPIRPGKLARWYPGVGVALAEPGENHPEARRSFIERGTWRWHRLLHAGEATDHHSGDSTGRHTSDATGTRGSAQEATPATDAADAGDPAREPAPANEAAHPRHSRALVVDIPIVMLDARAYLADRERGVRWLDTLLHRTADRPPHLGYLGLHEWAMVYRQRQHRHDLPLRLGQEATDAVVDAHPIRCSHIDAFRFFTDAARPRNRLQPTRATQPDLEQPGCLHANMDLLKAAHMLGPACPGDLLLDCFALARDIRLLDMQASPYDVRVLGHRPVTIETASGRAEYIARQREFADRAAPLRARLAEITRALLAHADQRPDSAGASRPLPVGSSS